MFTSEGHSKPRGIFDILYREFLRLVQLSPVFFILLANFIVSLAFIRNNDKYTRTNTSYADPEFFQGEGGLKFFLFIRVINMLKWNNCFSSIFFPFLFIYLFLFVCFWVVFFHFLFVCFITFYSIFGNLRGVGCNPHNPHPLCMDPPMWNEINCGQCNFYT